MYVCITFSPPPYIEYLNSTGISSTRIDILLPISFSIYQLVLFLTCWLIYALSLLVTNVWCISCSKFHVIHFLLRVYFLCGSVGVCSLNHHNRTVASNQKELAQYPPHVLHTPDEIYFFEKGICSITLSKYSPISNRISVQGTGSPWYIIS